MKLYLARHGEALGPEIDIKRPLTENGKKKVARLGNFLAPAGILVSQVYHSGKLRAQQTAEILGATIARGQQFIILPDLDSPEGAKNLAEEISGWADDALVVGHIPLMPRLVSELVVQDENRLLVDFGPATLVCLERLDLVRWCIAWVLRPELIPNNFKEKNE